MFGLRRRFGSCWPTARSSCARVSGCCSRPPGASPSSAKRPAARRRSRWAGRRAPRAAVFCYSARAARWQAAARAALLRPDMVLIDATLPGLDRVQAIRRISSESRVPVIVLIASQDDEHTLPAVRAGAAGLLPKDTEPPELVRAVEILARGGALLPPTLTRRLIAELASRPEPVAPSPSLLDELTAREREVVTLVGHGLGNHEIAERLVVSPATAKTHVSRAMVKLNARDRAKLVVFAYETGLVRPRSDIALRKGRGLAVA